MAVFSHFLQKMGVNVFIFFYSKENTAIVLVFITYDGN